MKYIVKTYLLHVSIFITLLLLTHVTYAFPLSLSLEIPTGINKTTIYTFPNQTLESCLILESKINKPVDCTIKITSIGCTLIYKGRKVTEIIRNFHFSIAHISKVLIFSVKVNNRSCIVKLHASCEGESITLVKRIYVKRQKSSIKVYLIAPSDSLCRFNAKIAKYTYVVTPGVINPILKLVSGLTESVHPHFIGFMCVHVSGPGYYTIVILFDNGKLPIASTSPESAAFGVHTGIIVLEGIPGNSSEVFPLWSYVNPMKIIGTHIVKVLVYPYGGTRPILEKTYHIKIVCLEETALLLVAFAGLVAVPVFVIIVVRTLRKISLKETVLCSLTGCLIFVTAVIPSYVLWGIASVLGPFDWTVWGLVYDVVRMILIGIALSLRPRPGTFAMISLIVWILSVLYFGRLSILSILWVATTAMFYELFLLIFRAYGQDDLHKIRAALAFVPATLVDTYVDLMLYMTLYRLYYANWYVAMYVLGMTLYSMIGFVTGLRLARYVRQVARE